MRLTRRKRRQTLLALLPVLAFVWALLPALPCCHELGVVPGDDVDRVAMDEHAGHHGSPGADDGFAVEHGANHCDEGSVASADAPCTDIEKTSNDTRPVFFASALGLLTSTPPVLHVGPPPRPPLPAPSPPPRYRPLHLEKSVLLI